MSGGGPLGAELPGERTLESYRGGQLRLTDRRVVYQGKGLRRHESLSVHLEDITAVSVRRGIGLNLYLAVIPVGLFFTGLVLAVVESWDDLFLVGLLWAALTAPLAFAVPVRRLRIDVPGSRIAVRVPRPRLADAKAFLDRIEAVRAERRGAGPRPEAPAPTVRPYRA